MSIHRKDSVHPACTKPDNADPDACHNRAADRRESCVHCRAASTAYCNESDAAPCAECDVHELRGELRAPRVAMQMHREQVMHLEVLREERKNVVMQRDDTMQLEPFARDLEMIFQHIVSMRLIAPEDSGG